MKRVASYTRFFERLVRKRIIAVLLENTKFTFVAFIRKYTTV